MCTYLQCHTSRDFPKATLYALHSNTMKTIEKELYLSASPTVLLCYSSCYIPYSILYALHSNTVKKWRKSYSSASTHSIIMPYYCLTIVGNKRTRSEGYMYVCMYVYHKARARPQNLSRASISEKEVQICGVDTKGTIESGFCTHTHNIHTSLVTFTTTTGFEAE